jgi:hypothetical protein
VPQAGFLLFGVAFGVIFQRSRFCLVRAFREPFLSGEAPTRGRRRWRCPQHAGFAVLKFTDPRTAVNGSSGFGIGALRGGSCSASARLAGGCGAGLALAGAAGEGR